MPLPAIIPLLASVGASIGGTLLSNRANRRAIDRQNAYNDPRMQMARLQSAGLNPHLVYGGGVQGATGMQSSTQSVDKFEPPVDFMSQLQSHVASRRMEAEIPNIEKQQAVMDADIALKGSQTAEGMSRTARNRFDLQQADRLKDVSAEAAMQNLQNLRTANRKMHGEIGLQSVDRLLKESNIRASDQSIRESSQRIRESADRIKSGISNRKLQSVETEIKRIELNLRRLGINPNDPAWSRIMGRILDESGATGTIIESMSSDAPIWKAAKGWLGNSRVGEWLGLGN